jgi:hypothetical protein
LLVGRSSCGREGPAPECRIDLRDHRAIGRHAPTVERPEMHVVLGVLADVAQPGNACVRGLRSDRERTEHGPNEAGPQWS